MSAEQGFNKVFEEYQEFLDRMHRQVRGKGPENLASGVDV